MITIISSSEQIMREIGEFEKAIYWLKKKYHGDAGYARMCDDLMTKSLDTQCDQRSERVEYQSPTGNKWIAFEYSTFYPDDNRAESITITFCYRQTAASLEIFVPVFEGYDRHKAAIVYTPHFFLRYNQRGKATITLEDIINDFVPSLTQQRLFRDKPGKKGMVRFDVRLKGGIGRGWVRKDCDTIYEVRSYLDDRDLTKKQLRETERTRTYGDMCRAEKVYNSQALQFGRLEPIRAINEIIAVQKTAGMDTTLMMKAKVYSVLLITSFSILGYADLEDISFWKRHWQNCKDITLRFVDRLVKDAGMVRADTGVQLIGFAAECAKRDGIENFSPQDYYLFVLIMLFHFDKEDAVKESSMLPATTQDFLDAYGSQLYALS